MRKYLDVLPNTIKQLIKYGLVGVLNVIIYFGINNFLIKNYDYFANHLITASVIAGVVSFLNGLFFNRKWTFRSESNWVRDTTYITAIFFACMVVQNLVYGGMIFFYKNNYNYELEEKKYLLYAQVLGVVSFASLNFTLNKLITFRTVKEQDLDLQNKNE